MTTDPDRQRLELELRLRGPKRANPGKAPEPQADAGHLPLFVAANEPELFAARSWLDALRDPNSEGPEL
jgi:hypothetical protein